MTRLLLSILLFALAGCSTRYEQLRDYAGPDSGTVLVSVGMTNENTMHYASLTVRQKGSQNLVDLKFSPRAAAYFGGTSIDFRDANGSYSLLQLKLPPGEYEIFEYGSGANLGTSMVWVGAPAGLAIPFSVKRGEVTYLGQYRVGLNVLGGKPVSSFLEISSERQRDTGKLQPATKLNDAADAILQGNPNAMKRVN